MWNFRQVINTGDTRYLYILKDYYELPKEYPDQIKWYDIFWDYIDKKGIEYNFKLRIELQTKLAILENEQIFEDKKNNVKIEMTKLKLETLAKEVQKGSDIENDAILSKYLGFQVNPKTTTVSQYIGYEKLLISANEASKKHGVKN